MINQIAIPNPLANGLTPLLSKFLALPELRKHRAMVAVELEVLAKKLDRFGWERDRGSMAHDRMLTDWMDALQDYPLDEVKAACVAAVLDNPNKMPNEGHVRAQILAKRAKIVAAIPKPVAVEPVSEKTEGERKRMADLVASAFPNLKRFGGAA